MKYKNREEGITLLALIITIVVTLILVGVSIVATTSQEGVLSKTEEAVAKQKLAMVEEGLVLVDIRMEMDKYLNGTDVSGTIEDVIEGLEGNEKTADDEFIVIVSSESDIEGMLDEIIQDLKDRGIVDGEDYSVIKVDTDKNGKDESVSIIDKTTAEQIIVTVGTDRDAILNDAIQGLINGF